MILWGIFYIIATFFLGYFFIKEKTVIELTKKFEEFVRWDVSTVVKYFEENSSKVKWEFVVLF